MKDVYNLPYKRLENNCECELGHVIHSYKFHIQDQWILVSVIVTGYSSYR